MYKANFSKVLNKQISVMRHLHISPGSLFKHVCFVVKHKHKTSIDLPVCHVPLDIFDQFLYHGYTQDKDQGCKCGRWPVLAHTSSSSEACVDAALQQAENWLLRYRTDAQAG